MKCRQSELGAESFTCDLGACIGSGYFFLGFEVAGLVAGLSEEGIGEGDDLGGEVVG